MAQTAGTASSEKLNQNLVEILVEFNVKRTVAIVLVVIHSEDHIFSSRIQKLSGLSQTDVSKATSFLSRQGLISHDVIHRDGPGRPLKRYHTTMNLRQSVEQLISNERSLIQTYEENLITIQNLAEEATLNTRFKVV